MRRKFAAPLHVSAVQGNPPSHVARLYRNGQLLSSAAGVQGSNVQYRALEFGNVAAWVAPQAVSEWKWLRHNLSDVDDLRT